MIGLGLGLVAFTVVCGRTVGFSLAGIIDDFGRTNPVAQGLLDIAWGENEKTMIRALLVLNAFNLEAIDTDIIGAVYGRKYLLGTAIARPLLAKRQGLAFERATTVVCAHSPRRSTRTSRSASSWAWWGRCGTRTWRAARPRRGP